VRVVFSSSDKQKNNDRILRGISPEFHRKAGRPMVLFGGEE
jgi:hypothetical protein